MGYIWKSIFLGALAGFILLATQQLHLPGLNYDEALDAVPAMQFVQERPLTMAATLTFAGREWPLMVMPYIGAVSTYLYIPFFMAFPIDTVTLRVANVVVGLLSLVVIGGFLRAYLDDRAATLTVLLLAVSPTFVFWSRMGNYVALPMLPLAIGMLWSLFTWYRTGRGRCLALAALLLGLGLSTKIIFLWWGNALLLGWLILSPWLYGEHGASAWLWPFRRAPLRAWLAGGVALLLGSSMLIVYNLRELSTLQVIRRNAVTTELYGINNLELATNLRIRLVEDFREFLDGGWFETVLGGPHRNVLLPMAFLLAAGTVVLLIRSGRLVYSGKRLALLSVILVAILLQSTITISGLGANHLMILWPIPQATIAVALLGVADLAREHLSRHRNVAVAFCLLAYGAVAGSELYTTVRYHSTLSETGGRIYFSDAINELASDLERERVLEPVALDWGFERNLQLLSGGRIVAEETFEYTQHPDELFDAYINWRVGQEPALYLFHVPEHTAFAGHLTLFERAAYRHRLEPVLWKEYTERTGKPIYHVYALRPVEPEYTVPEISNPLDVDVADSIELLGYDIYLDPPDPVDEPLLILYWRARVPIPHNYKVFIHMLDPAGALVAQVDTVPVEWGYPTNEWQPGEVVEDRIRIPLAEVHPGEYRLFIGMYNAEDGARAPLFLDGTRQEGDTFALTKITVTEQFPGR